MAEFIQSDHALIWCVQLTEVKDEIKNIFCLVSGNNHKELFDIKGFGNAGNRLLANGRAGNIVEIDFVDTPRLQLRDELVCTAMVQNARN